MNKKGQIVTFYSYKGGAGRTMALANVATLLSSWGYNILIVDWDLEAPGLENFFQNYCHFIEIHQKNGLIDLLYTASQDLEPGNFLDNIIWKDYIIDIRIKENQPPIHLLTAGCRNDEYFKKVRGFDIDNFYDEKDGGYVIEKLRDQWKSMYDFILLDSRTGITDIAGICTIQLPDILIAMCAPTESALSGIINVAEKVDQANQMSPFDRPGVLIAPIVSRVDDLDKRLYDEWLDHASKELFNLYDNWCPRDINILEFIEITRLPYISRFSYRERLAVLDERVSDPRGLGYAYTTLAALIAHKLDNISLLVENRTNFVKAVATKGTYSPLYISYREEESLEFTRQLYDRLSAHMLHGEISLDAGKLNNGLSNGENIKNAMRSCEALIVVIGNQWLTITNKTGHMKSLDDRNDIVRLEIESALERTNIRIFPVLIQNASIPHDSDLPQVLKKLASINEYRVREENFLDDVDRLIDVLDTALSSSRASSSSRSQIFRNSIDIGFVMIPVVDTVIQLYGQKRINQPFYLSRYPVTQAQWRAVMGKAFTGDPNLPISGLTWDEVQEFISRLNALESHLDYRLPTLEEWEYAARAESKSAYCFGDDVVLLDEYAWYNKNAEGKMHPVGQLKPNAWGLYDIHGNVWEWVQTGSTSIDISKDQPTSQYFYCGGSWRADARRCQFMTSYYYTPTSDSTGLNDIGFRLLKEIA